MANINGSLFIDLIISFVTIPLAETPIKTSLFFINSFKESSFKLLGVVNIFSSNNSLSTNE